MLKFFPLLILALIFYGPCSKKRPSPIPFPSPQPTVQPTPEPAPTGEPSPITSPEPEKPIPVGWATPYPTPDVNPANYIPAPRAGSIVRLRGEEGEDYAAKIQAVMDNSENVSQVFLGPGSLKRSIIVRTHIFIDTTKSNPLVCDQVEGIVGDIKPGEQPWNQLIPHSDYGCILVADGVHVSGNFKPPQELLDYFAQGKSYLGYKDPYFQKLAALTDDQIQGEYSTIVEPSFSLGPANPGVFVIQALEDVKESHRNAPRNIAVTGIVITGRQQTYDGGVRQAVALGNCQTCLIQRVFLRDTASIGLQAGGVAADKGNFANNVIFTENISSGVAAANIAIVNGENVYAYHNYTRRPGRKGFGGGISSVDVETNSPHDHTKNIFIYNNLADYESSAHPTGAGSAFVAQDPYEGENHGKVVIANNVAIGGRGDTVFRNMSNGLYLVGLKDCEIINNYVYRTGQNGLQAYNSVGCLIQDNDFHHTGGGGAPTVQFYGVRNTTIRRSHFRSDPDVPISVQAGFQERDGSCGNKFEENLIDGKGFTQSSPACPAN